MRSVIAVMFAVAACGGGDDGGGGAQPDAAGSAAACTGAVYDVCTDNAQCSSQNCHYYQQSNFTVCTQACSASNPCPNDSSGTPGTCNNMGICKPAAATSCTR